MFYFRIELFHKKSIEGVQFTRIPSVNILEVFWIYRVKYLVVNFERSVMNKECIASKRLRNFLKLLWCSCSAHSEVKHGEISLVWHVFGCVPVPLFLCRLLWLCWLLRLRRWLCKEIIWHSVYAIRVAVKCWTLPLCISHELDTDTSCDTLYR